MKPTSSQANHHPSLSDKDIAQTQVTQKRIIRQHSMLLWMSTVILGFLPAIFVLAARFDPYVKQNAKQALNLFISTVVYMLILLVLGFYFMDYSDGMSVSFLGSLYLFNIFYVTLCIMGFIKSSKLENFQLPLVLRFFR